MLGNISQGASTSRSRRDILKSIGALGATAVGGAVASGSAAAVGSSAVYQYYHTPWTDVKSDLAAIADVGYDAVQLPPAQNSKLTWSDQEGTHHPPLGYQPINHKSFNSQFGTEQQYDNLVDEAHDQGLDVIADAVMNHMAYGEDYDYPYFGYNDFHHEGEIDYSDPWSVENGDLSGLPDLEQESSYVRGQLKDYTGNNSDNFTTNGDAWVQV